MNRTRTKLLAFLNIARELSALSNCERAGVGCVIIPKDFSRVLAIGYNGPASGVANDSCTGAEGACGCVHAEVNALLKLTWGRAHAHALLCHTAPCPTCAGAIVNSGSISRVVYSIDYRDPRGIEILRAGKVIPFRVTEELPSDDQLREWW